MPANTPYYQFPYLTGTDRMRATPGISKAQAERFEQALRDASVPPGDWSNINSALSRIAALESSYPRGLVATKTQSGNSGRITTATVIDNLASFTFRANRNYRISWQGNYYTNGIATMQLSITHAPTSDPASSLSNLVTLRSLAHRITVAGEGRGYLLRGRVKFSADTTRQVKVMAGRATGDGDAVFTSGGPGEGVIDIEDLGTAI